MSNTFEYKFKLDVGSWSVPVVGGGYIDGNPFYNDSGLTYALEEDEIFARIKFNGTLQFVNGSNPEYDALNLLRATGKKISIKIYKDTTEIAEGKLSLLGEWDNDKSTCKLNVEIIDQYTNILENKSEVVDILDLTPLIKCDVDKPIYEYYEDSTTSEGTYTTTKYGTRYHSISHTTDGTVGGIVATEADELIYAPYMGNLLPVDSTWGYLTVLFAPTRVDGSFIPAVFYGTVYAKFVRQILYVPYFDGVYNDPDATYTYVEDVTLNGRSYRKYARPVTGSWTNSGRSFLTWGGFSYDLTNVDNYLNFSEDIVYTRFRHLKDVITLLVQTADSTIQFDDDSFAYLNNNSDLTDILIAGITDIILSEGAERTDGQTISEMSFEQLFNYLKERFKLYYEIEYIGGVPYFRLKHRSEVLYSIGSLIGNDLTDLYSKNWTEGKSNYKFNQEKYYRTKRNEIAQNIDFLGTDILVDSITEIYPNTKEISYNEIFTDIWDIQTTGSRYPDNSNDKFVIITANRKSQSNYLANRTPINSSVNGWDTFTGYVEGFDASDTASSAWLYFNQSFTVVNNSTYKITLDCTYLSGSTAYCRILSDPALIGNSISNSVRLVEGENIIYLRATSSDDTAYLAFANLGGNANNIEVRNIRFETYDFRIRTGTGALTGLEDVANVELSIANLDETHGQYEIDGTPATINNVSTALTSVQLNKDREQQTIEAPVLIDEIDMTSLVKTDLGNLEPDEVKIYFNKKFSEIKGKL